MIQLKKITIHGFKTPERIVVLEFPDTQLSVIYGNNGCGKTTLLRIIQAIFNQDGETLIKEKVQTIEIEYYLERDKMEIKNAVIAKAMNTEKSNAYDWEGIKELTTSSILFGVNRGMILKKFELSEDEIDLFLIRNGYALILDQKKSEFKHSLYEFIKEKSNENLDPNTFDFEASRYQENHLYVDDMRIEVIQSILVHHQQKKEANIEKLKSIYNSYIQKGKELIITESEAYIKLDSNRHDLDQLSSGERHLLTFLAMFILEGKTRDFLLIDEPEMSLDIEWQRKIMDIFMEACPNSQIIVASHSPSIGYPSTSNIVNME